jgi:hypothetical protein
LLPISPSEYQIKGTDAGEILDTDTPFSRVIWETGHAREAFVEHSALLRVKAFNLIDLSIERILRNFSEASINPILRRFRRLTLL